MLNWAGEIGKKVVSLNSYVGLLIWNNSGPNIAVMELSIRTFLTFFIIIINVFEENRIMVSQPKSQWWV